MDTDTTNIVLYHSLIIFGELLIVFVLTHMLYNRRTPASIIAWLLSMILIPYISVILYFILGFRKRKNRYTKKPIKLQQHTTSYNIDNPIHEVLKTYDVSDAVQNREFVLYTDSKEAYDEFMQCIMDAKSKIYISTYLFGYDDVSKGIIEALIKKANEGVEIKILIDSLGSLCIYLLQYKLKDLKNAGAEIEFFMPIFQMPFRNYINLRNHRKIYIFDDKKVISGGMNISKKYFGPKLDEERWEDMLFLIEGSSTQQFFEIFASDWFYASQEKIYFKEEKSDDKGGILLQVVPSGPDMSQDALYEALLCGIYNAKKRIWIVTPYFIPDKSLIQSLLIAKHKGVDVRLITPKESNHIIANLARSSYMRELEEAGIEIFLHNGSMLHAKAILFDDESAMLGSVNIDNRSLFLNYEVATFVYNANSIVEIESWMKKLIYNSSTGTKKRSAPRIILENLTRIIAPQL